MRCREIYLVKTRTSSRDGFHPPASLRSASSLREDEWLLHPPSGRIDTGRVHPPAGRVNPTRVDPPAGRVKQPFVLPQGGRGAERRRRVKPVPATRSGLD